MTYQVGIDLGATATAAAVYRSGMAEPVRLGARSPVLPTVASANADGTLAFGDDARQPGVLDPGRVARLFTRRIGDHTPLRLGPASVTADVLAARFVAHVVRLVATRRGGQASRIAVTHPTGWGQHRVASLRSALAAEGFEAVVFLSAAQAAAQAHAGRVRVSAGELVAVADIGGCGVDAAVVGRLDDGRFAPAGRPEELDIGGLDLDEVVFGHVQAAVGERWAELDPADPIVLAGIARLRHECTLAKEALSADTEVQIPVVLPGIDTRVRLARAEFDELIRPAVDEFAATLQRAIAAAGSGPTALAAVLLAGGSARIPLLTQVVSAQLGKPVAVAVDPKGGTAIGAALAVGRLAEPTTSVRQPVPTKVELRAVSVPGAAEAPDRPPLVTAAPLQKSKGHTWMRVPRAVATGVAALLVAVLVVGAIALAKRNGPHGADADPIPPPPSSSTPASSPKAPRQPAPRQPAPRGTTQAEPPRPTTAPRPQQTQQQPPAPPTPPTITSTEPTTTTQPTTPTTTPQPPTSPAAETSVSSPSTGTP